jgi:hypothetical protein
MGTHTGSNPYILPISGFTTGGELTITVGIIGSATVPIFYYVPPIGTFPVPVYDTIYIGGTVKIIADVYPSNATNKDITWKSSDESIATVSSTGPSTCLVRGVSAGKVTITVTIVDGGFTASCPITVTVPKIGQSLAKSLSLNKKTGYSGSIGNSLNISELKSIGYTVLRITLTCSITRKTVFGGNILGLIYDSGGNEIGNLSHIPSYNKQETFEIDIWPTLDHNLGSLIVTLTVPNGGNSGDDYKVENLNITIQAL